MANLNIFRKTTEADFDTAADRVGRGTGVTEKGIDGETSTYRKCCPNITLCLTGMVKVER